MEALSVCLRLTQHRTLPFYPHLTQLMLRSYTTN